MKFNVAAGTFQPFVTRDCTECMEGDREVIQKTIRRRHSEDILIFLVLVEVLLVVDWLQKVNFDDGHNTLTHVVSLRKKTHRILIYARRFTATFSATYGCCRCPPALN